MRGGKSLPLCLFTLSPIFESMCNGYPFKTKPLTDYFCYHLTINNRPNFLGPKYLLGTPFVLDHLGYAVTCLRPGLPYSLFCQWP
ncbi:hypothetical protein K449DRAFT_123474 [Hypoxylon sp. EC38]|nr:hypothetical protein K449DRAFT_123474 [Hypoxylon sp. EC38]